MAHSKERLRGGRGDRRPDSKFDAEQLAAGIKVEMEHTDDPSVAKEIAKDHLTEDPDYYKKLLKAKLSRTAAAQYARDYVRVVRYAAEHGGVEPFLRQIPISSWQGKPTADHNARLAASDYLRDLDRGHEADLLADTTKHVYLEDGEVKAAADIPNESRFTKLSSDERQLLESWLWAAPLNHRDEELEDLYSIGDIEEGSASKMLADWRHFKSEHAEDIGDDPGGHASHHFVLSRNEGGGFGDATRHYGDEQATKLHKAAKAYGTFDLLDNDGSVGAG